MISAVCIAQTVDDLVKRYGTRDPYALCGMMSVKIHRMDLEHKLKGFFFYCARQKNIVVDTGLNDVLERVLVAHELGHALLHQEISMMRGFQEMELMEERDDQPEENEANLFAAELLLPDEEVLKSLSRMSFFESARALYVPAALLDYKLTMLKAKGYGMNVMDCHRSDFLKEDLGDYDSRWRYECEE